MIDHARLPVPLLPTLQHMTSGALVLLTHTLGTNTNWLVAKFLAAYLGSDSTGSHNTRYQTAGDSIHDAPRNREIGGPCGVMLVSWMRNREFWLSEARRINGLDLDMLSQKKRFCFLDQLTSIHTQPRYSTDTSCKRSPSAEFARLKEDIESALISLDPNPVLLILDNPDVALAFQEPSSSSMAVSLSAFLHSLRLHPKVHGVVVALCSDGFGIVPRHHNGLPQEHITVDAHSATLGVGIPSIALSLAHAADLVISTRGLQTGTAEDVSGVVRITQSSQRDHSKEQRDALYVCNIDGKDEIWERAGHIRYT